MDNISDAERLAIIRAKSDGWHIMNYQLAAAIAADKGLQWLRKASDKELSAATDERCKRMGVSMDTRQAVTCLKAIRAYAERTGKLLA